MRSKVQRFNSSTRELAVQNDFRHLSFRVHEKSFLSLDAEKSKSAKCSRGQQRTLNVGPLTFEQSFPTSLTLPLFPPYKFFDEFLLEVQWLFELRVLSGV